MKKLIALFLSFFILFNSINVSYVRADSMGAVIGTLELVGGSGAISTVGLAAVATIGLVVLAAIGYDIYISNRAIDSGVTKKQWLQNKIIEYSNYINQGLDVTIQGLYKGLNIATNGYIRFSDVCSARWAEFVNFLELGITDVIPDESYNMGNQKLADISGVRFKWSATVSRTHSYNYDNDSTNQYLIYAVYFDSLDTMLYFGTNGQYLQSTWDNSGKLLNTSSSGTSSSALTNQNLRYGFISKFSELNGFYVEKLPVAIGQDMVNTTTDFYKWLNKYYERIKLGSIADEGVLIGEITDIPDIGEITSPVAIPNAEISVDDYLDLIDGVIEENPDIPLPDVIHPDITDNPDISDDLPDSIVDDLPDLPPYAPIDKAPYIFDLIRFFPFCVPYDLYALVDKLSAEPKAPVFTYHLSYKNIIDKSFTIDLSIYDSLAEYVRITELILYILSLVLATRKLLRA